VWHERLQAAVTADAEPVAARDQAVRLQVLHMATPATALLEKSNVLRVNVYVVLNTLVTRSAPVVWNAGERRGMASLALGANELMRYVQRTGLPQSFAGNPCARAQHAARWRMEGCPELRNYEDAENAEHDHPGPQAGAEPGVAQ